MIVSRHLLSLYNIAFDITNSKLKMKILLCDAYFLISYISNKFFVDCVKHKLYYTSVLSVPNVSSLINHLCSKHIFFFICSRIPTIYNMSFWRSTICTYCPHEVWQTTTMHQEKNSTFIEDTDFSKSTIYVIPLKTRHMHYLHWSLIIV